MHLDIYHVLNLGRRDAFVIWAGLPCLKKKSEYSKQTAYAQILWIKSARFSLPCSDGWNWLGWLVQSAHPVRNITSRTAVRSLSQTLAHVLVVTAGWLG